MEGKFDLEGNLSIKRKSKLRNQCCYLHPHLDCNDRCILMGEPVIIAQGTKLEICKKEFIFNEFKDNRR